MRCTVRAERSGRWWSLQCVEVPGAISQVARLDQVDQIREAIAFVAQVPPGEVQIDLAVVLPDRFERHITAAERLADEAERAAAAARQERAAAVATLRQFALPLRDIGTILGVSHQRAQQLLELVVTEPEGTGGPGEGQMVEHIVSARPAAS